MREILFRGKMDNGEWVYGSFCMDALEQFNGLCGVDGFIRLYDKAEGKMKTYEVDRETVGQYTGLNDKNGKRIFEGDIVRFTWENYFLSSPGGYFMHPSGTVFEVRCLESGYMLCKVGDNALEPNANGKVANYDFWNFHRGLEVIGNIHDNKELLKGGEG